MTLGTPISFYRWKPQRCLELPFHFTDETPNDCWNLEQVFQTFFFLDLRSRKIVWSSVHNKNFSLQLFFTTRLPIRKNQKNLLSGTSFSNVFFFLDLRSRKINENPSPKKLLFQLLCTSWSTIKKNQEKSFVRKKTFFFLFF